MKVRLHKFFDEGYYKTSLLVILGAALILRLVALVFFVDAPGDGPMRAVGAFIWSRCPYLGIPDQRYLGFIYLAGIFSYPFNSPLFSARILNFILGTITVPLFYMLIRRLYGHQPAALSSALLALLPLHAGLSAGSMTEASFLFELIGGTLFLIIAVENPQKQWRYLSASLVCIVWATMTRFESWMFVPLFPAYYFFKTRNVKTTLAIIFVLGIFPLAWLTASYAHSGDSLSGYLFDAERGAAAVGEKAVGFLMGVGVLVHMMARNLGVILAIGIVGLVWQVARLASGKTSAEQSLYLAMVLLFGAFTVYFTSQRGWSLWNRYLLFGLVTMLPFIVLPFAGSMKRHAHLPILVFLLSVGSIGIATAWGLPSVHLRPAQPNEIKTLASWLTASPYRDDAVLLTRMGWHSTYLPLYAPALASCPSARFKVVSFWAEDPEVARFVKSERPALLITQDGDESFQARVENLFGAKLRTEDLVYRLNTTRVYDIRSYRIETEPTKILDGRSPLSPLT